MASFINFTEKDTANTLFIKKEFIVSIKDVELDEQSEYDSLSIINTVDGKSHTVLDNAYDIVKKIQIES